MSFKTIIMHADRPSISGNIYPKSVVKSVAARLRDKSITSYVVLDGENENIDLDRVCAKIVGARMKGDMLEADIEILSTPMGMILEEISKGDIKLRYYTMGSGMVSEDRIVSDYVLSSIGVTVDKKEEIEKGEENGEVEN